jgi:hypothetical protein
MKADIENEIQFGLENLSKVYERIKYISFLEADTTLKISALTYECFGYYNAVEHLILRFIKYLKMSVPSGSFYHKETLKNFRRLIDEYNICTEQKTLNSIEELMAFRHVATKIYGFLINEGKLEVIIDKIKNEHSEIVALIRQVLKAVS